MAQKLYSHLSAQRERKCVRYITREREIQYIPNIPIQTWYIATRDWQCFIF